MNLDERVNFHEQMLLSIERNLGALVEAQQRTEQRVDAVASHLDVLVDVQQRTEQRVDAVASHLDVLVDAQQRTEQQVDALASHMNVLTSRLDVLVDAQQRTDEQMNRVLAITSGLAQGTTENQGTLKDLLGIVGQLGDRVSQIAASLQRFLDSQSGRNGH